jgi:flavin-dependent dehydrogenase
VPLAGVEVYLRPQACMHSNFPTNHGLSRIAIQAPIAGFRAFRADREQSCFRAIDRAPQRAERVRAGAREERWYGSADLARSFRRPHGPGWALVGDAGYHMDPVTAQGITDAFRDAELLADAIDAGFAGRQSLDAALAA